MPSGQKSEEANVSCTSVVVMLLIWQDPIMVKERSLELFIHGPCSSGHETFQMSSFLYYTIIWEKQIVTNVHFR